MQAQRPAPERASVIAKYFSGTKPAANVYWPRALRDYITSQIDALEQDDDRKRWAALRELLARPTTAAGHVPVRYREQAGKLLAGLQAGTVRYCRRRPRADAPQLPPDASDAAALANRWPRDIHAFADLDATVCVEGAPQLRADVAAFFLDLLRQQRVDGAVSYLPESRPPLKVFVAPDCVGAVEKVLQELASLIAENCDEYTPGADLVTVEERTFALQSDALEALYAGGMPWQRGTLGLLFVPAAESKTSRRAPSPEKDT